MNTAPLSAPTLSPMRTSDLRSDRKAFTIVEILIASTILVAAMGMILSLFISAVDSYGVSVGKLNVNGDVRHFAETITRDAALSCDLSVQDSGRKVVLSYRDSTGTLLPGKITYLYNSAPGSGNTVTRTDSATGAVAVVARGVLPFTSGGPLFGTRHLGGANFNTVMVTGYVTTSAHSRRLPTVRNLFEFAITHQG